MKKFRWAFSICVLAGVTGVAVAQSGAGGRGGALPPPPKLTKIRDNIYQIENQQPVFTEIGLYGGNMTIFLTDDGVLLVDSKNERIHDDVRQKIRSLTDKPVKYLILTHNHGDHSGGAQKFASEGAEVIISSADRENLARTPNQSWLPSLTYSGQAQVFLGGSEIQLRQMRGHTRGDTVVYFPAEKVICAGDLVTLPWETIPLIVNYADGGNWTDWSASIKQILAMDFDTLIPGHGPAINKQQLSDLYQRMLPVIERFRTLNREKKSQEEITQTLIKEFNWGNGPAAGVIPGMMTELR